MSEKVKRYYSVQITKRMEVCVKAEDEGEAEQLARETDFDWVMADIEDACAEEMYNEPDEVSLIQEFKDDGHYAE